MFGRKMSKGAAKGIMTEHPIVGLALAAVVSLAVHGMAYASLAYVPAHAPAPPPSRVSFRISEPVPAPPPPPEPPKPAEPEPVNAAPPPRAATAEAPLPSAPPPVDLTGVTLTNDSGTATFSTVVGNGAALDRPIAGIATTRPAPPPAVSAPLAPARAEVPVLALSDLSERPVAPELGPVLRMHYPAEARARGIGGSASVEARIEPDGRVRTVTLASESFAGFGDACRKTLAGSRWSPPRDRDGRAVATRIRYTCRFVVDR
jgi:protein TonB